MANMPNTNPAILGPVKAELPPEGFGDELSVGVSVGLSVGFEDVVELVNDVILSVVLVDLAEVSVDDEFSSAVVGIGRNVTTVRVDVRLMIIVKGSSSSSTGCDMMGTV